MSFTQGLSGSLNVTGSVTASNFIGSSGATVSVTADDANALLVEHVSGDNALQVDTSTSSTVVTVGADETTALDVVSNQAATLTVSADVNNDSATTELPRINVQKDNGAHSAALLIEQDAGAAIFTGSSGDSTVLGTTSADSLEFATNSVVRTTIDSTGATSMTGSLTMTGTLDVTANGNILDNIRFAESGGDNFIQSGDTSRTGSSFATLRFSSYSDTDTTFALTASKAIVYDTNTFQIGGSAATADGITMAFDGSDLAIDAVNSGDTISFGSNIDEIIVGTANGLDMNNKKITNLATPTTTTDAVNKSYVDALVQGLSAKESVRAATTAAGTLISDFENGDTIDDVSLVTGDRILIKNQGDGTENGIYTVNVSGAPTRAADLDTGDSAAGAFVFVEEGTDNADVGYICTTDGPNDVVGTDAIAFGTFASATALSGGDGIDVSSNIVSIDEKANGGLVIESGELALNLSASSITGTLAVGDGGTGLTTATANGLLTGNGTSALTSETDLLYDGATKRLSVGTNNTTYAMELSGTDASPLSAANIGDGTASIGLKIVNADTTATSGAHLLFSTGTSNLGAIAYEQVSATEGDMRFYIEDGGSMTEKMDLSSSTLTIQSGVAVNINDTTSSSTHTTGALIVDGGVGIANDVNIDGHAAVGSSVNTASSIALYVSDDITGTADLTLLKAGNSNTMTATATGTNIFNLWVPAATHAYGAQASIAPTHSHAAFFQPHTITGSGTGGTVARSATVYVSGAPTNSHDNATVTNGPYAIFVAAGDVRFDGSLIFNDNTEAEKIASDGTDLTINSGNDINLTATTNVNIPSGVGLTFGDDGENISGDGTDLTITSSGTLNTSSVNDTTVLYDSNDDGAGEFQVGNGGTAYMFSIGPDKGPPTAAGNIVKVPATTFTDTATAGSGTTTVHVFNSFLRPTLDATNSSVTTTDSATVYIANSPANGANNTITNAYSLWVDAGAVRFDSTLTVEGDINANGNIVGDAATNISGIATLTATNLAGTLTTAAQTNVTSLGTLTSLTISGDLILDNSRIFLDTTATDTEIQAALDAYDHVVLADGIYTIGTTLTITSSTRKISGTGHSTGGTVLDAAFGLSGPLLSITGGAGLHVENINFKHATQDTPSSLVTFAGRNIVIDNCSWTDVQTNVYAISMFGGTDQMVITNCLFENYAGGGITLGNTSDYILIENNHFELVTQRPINASVNCQHLTVGNNVFDTCGYCEFSADYQNINGNHFSETVATASTGAINVTTSIHTQLTGNIIEGTTVGSGIHLSSTAGHVGVVGNHIRGSALDGIVCDSDGCTITSNICVDNTGNGIELTSTADENNVTENYMRDNASPDLNIDATGLGNTVKDNYVLESYTGSGAINPSNSIANLDTTGGGAYTLADLTQVWAGHRLKIRLVTDAGNATITPTSLVNRFDTSLTDVVLDDAEDFVILEWLGTSWKLIDESGASGLTEDLAVTGTLTVSGDLAVDNVTVNGNTVSTSSGNLTLDSTGGTLDVNDNIDISGHIQMSTVLAAPTHAEGIVFYDKDEHTLAVYNDQSAITHQLGQEGQIRVYNNSGLSILDGMPVYLSGTEGVEDRPTIALARADAQSTSRVIGVTTQTIGNGSFGYITEWGLINNLDTSSFATGDILYLDETTAGGFRTSPPPIGNFEVRIGFVIKSNATTGRILVATQVNLGAQAGDAKEIVIDAQKGSAGTINAGQTVYISGYDNGADVVEVELADASSAATMPAIGITRDSLGVSTTGKVVLIGRLTNQNTSSFSDGDAVYVSETAGDVTNVKPTGTALIQRIGTVSRSHSSQGSIDIIGPGRTNDLPNLNTNSFWVGNGSSVPTETTNLTFDGTTLTVTGDLAVDNVTVNGNTVSTSSGNLILDSTGNNVIVASGNNVGIGLTTPASILEVGEVDPATNDATDAVAHIVANGHGLTGGASVLTLENVNGSCATLAFKSDDGTVNNASFSGARIISGWEASETNYFENSLKLQTPWTENNYTDYLTTIFKEGKLGINILDSSNDDTSTTISDTLTVGGTASINGASETTLVTLPAASALAGSAPGDYFTIDSPTAAFYVWFDKDNTNSDPAPGGTGIEVDILAADTASDVAGKVATAVDGNANFHAVQGSGVATNRVIIRNDAAGTATNATTGSGPAGLSVSVLNEGSYGSLSINGPVWSGGALDVNGDILQTSNQFLRSRRSADGVRINVAGSVAGNRVEIGSDVVQTNQNAATTLRLQSETGSVGFSSAGVAGGLIDVWVGGGGAGNGAFNGANAGNFDVLGGTGGAAGDVNKNGGAGTSVNITAGDGGAGGVTLGTGGAGGTITLTPGTGSTTGNTNGVDGTIELAGSTNVTGSLSINGASTTVSTGIDSSSAIDPTDAVVIFTLTADRTPTLDDGKYIGQTITLIQQSGAFKVTITPTTTGGFTSLILDGVNDYYTLIWAGTSSVQARWKGLGGNLSGASAAFNA